MRAGEIAQKVQENRKNWAKEQVRVGEIAQKVQENRKNWAKEQVWS